jgi:hypothetical protein
MAAIPSKVYIVVDREFGEKLAELERSVPVWIGGTPIDKSVVQRLWNERPDESHLTGVTAFNDLNSLCPEEMLLSHLDAIELHHGVYSANPGYTILEVFGAELLIRRRAYGPNTASTSSKSPQPDLWPVGRRHWTPIRRVLASAYGRVF